jgi:hypothetical protein
LGLQNGNILFVSWLASKLTIDSMGLVERLCELYVHDV